MSSSINFRTSSEQDIISCLRVNYHKTALSKKSGTAYPTKKLLEYLKDHPKIKGKIITVLDYGCGKGRDLQCLKSNFRIYYGYDPYKSFGCETNRKNVLSRKYDLIVCNYVLNVIVLVDRIVVIDDLKKFLMCGSVVLLGVRTDTASIKMHWIEFQDGFITSKPSFQHFFTTQEIERIFQKNCSVEVLDSKGAYLLIPKTPSKDTIFNFI